MAGGTRPFQVGRSAPEKASIVKLRGLDRSNRSGYTLRMDEMEVEDSGESQGNATVSRRPYTAPVLERHDEWHLVTGLAPSMVM